MNIASHILYALLSKTKIIWPYSAIVAIYYLNNDVRQYNGIGGHQKINIYHTKTIYRKPRKQKNKK